MQKESVNIRAKNPKGKDLQTYQSKKKKGDNLGKIFVIRVALEE